MFAWIKRLIYGRSLEADLNETKTVKIAGIRFRIKRINVLDHLNGSDVIKKTYDNYKIGKGQEQEMVNQKKIKEYYAQILVAGVVNPQISFKQDDVNKIWVEKLMTRWDIVEGLYSEILDFTYGKKKVINSFTSQMNGPNI